jgi:hypothetical protein
MYATEGEALMGVSDKYGQVTTERHGKTGPIGEDEPVALFRAQDALSIYALEYYYELCSREPDIPEDQLNSVEKQIENFKQWQLNNIVRLPGTGGE